MVPVIQLSLSIPSLHFAESSTRQKIICRVSDKLHSANLAALGKEPDFGSDVLLWHTIIFDNH
jgi:hypothetical protein